MTDRERELTTLVMQLAERLEICSRLLGKCAERKACKNCKERGEQGESERS